jgi:hypothetical protein
MLAGMTVLVGGCVSALREPPPVAELGGGAANQPTTPPGAENAVELQARADADFARRPDVVAVERAKAGYLAAARADEDGVEGLLGAARTIAWLVEREGDAPVRERLATEAVQVCQWCLRRSPESVECNYRLALALGQQARERPSTANDALPRIVSLLEGVIAANPLLDSAGGERVLALVLLRSPGWPTGPGDPEAGLEHARSADARVPDHPPNLLVLGEALAANGDTAGARRTYERAVQLAQIRASTGDADAPEWVEAATIAHAALR